MPPEEKGPAGPAAPAQAGAPDPAAPNKGSEAAGQAPPEKPVPQGTLDAIKEARARLEAGESIVPKPAGEEKPEETVKPEGGEAPAGDEKPDDEAKEEGEEGDEEKGEDKGGDEPPEAKFFDVKLPAPPDREAMEIVVDSQEVADRINWLTNQAMDGQRVRAAQDEIEQDREELARIEDYLSVDPSGFMLDKLTRGEHGDALRVDVALNLLSDPATLEAINTRLAERATRDQDAPTTLHDLLQDARELRALRGDLASARVTARSELEQAARDRQTMKTGARTTAKTVAEMLPANIVGEQRDRLYREVMKAVETKGRELKLAKMGPTEVRLLVAEHLATYGLEPRMPDTNGGKPASPAAPERAPAGKLGPTAKELQDRANARRRAAAPAPAGAGAPDAKARPSFAGKSTKDALDYIRKHGMAAALGHK